MSCAKRKRPQPGEVVSRWRAVEWGEHEEQRLVDILFDRLPNKEKGGAVARN
jgi:hypothetical protein